MAHKSFLSTQSIFVKKIRIANLTKQLLVSFLLFLLAFQMCLPFIFDSIFSTTYCFEKTATKNSIKIPAVMYHSILKSKKGKYIVTPFQLEEDLIAFQKLGYTTVFPKEIIDYVKFGKKLPKKPILISFDDGYYNNLIYALPILQKHNAKAILSPVGAFSEYSSSTNDNNHMHYSHLTWKQLKQIADSGNFEIGNHTFEMHKLKPRCGIARRKNETMEEYKTNLTCDLEKLQNTLSSKVGVTPQVFVYPFGKYSKECEPILKSMGFEMVLTCFEMVSTAKVGDEKSLYRFGRYNRSGNISTEQFVSKIEKEMAKT